MVRFFPIHGTPFIKVDMATVLASIHAIPIDNAFVLRAFLHGSEKRLVDEFVLDFAILDHPHGSLFEMEIEIEISKHLEN